MPLSNEQVVKNVHEQVCILRQTGPWCFFSFFFPLFLFSALEVVTKN